VKEEAMEDQPRSSLRRPSRAPGIILLILALAAGVGVGFWLRGRSGEPERAAAPEVAAAADGGEAEGPVVAVDPAKARSLLEAVSSNPLYRSWIGQGDVVRRWVVVTDNLAEGTSPRAQLLFLAPALPFTVEKRGGATYIAAAAYQRYDAAADAIASIDAAALGRVYRELHAPLQSAYRALGYPGASLDAVTARALHRLADAVVPPGQVAVVPAPKGGGYLFADPRLEELGPVEKHLLRLGPRNAPLVQEKARQLLAELGTR
jgi:hypothetical protein